MCETENVLTAFMIMIKIEASVGKQIYFSGRDGRIPGSEVIKLFSSSTQLSMKVQLLINIEIIKISGNFRFKTQ